jgi:hypothetical protein
MMFYRKHNLQKKTRKLKIREINRSERIFYCTCIESWDEQLE